VAIVQRFDCTVQIFNQSLYEILLLKDNNNKTLDLFDETLTGENLNKVFFHNSGQKFKQS
jgi:hypothetical protein